MKIWGKYQHWIDEVHILVSFSLVELWDLIGGKQINGFLRVMTYCYDHKTHYEINLSFVKIVEELRKRLAFEHWGTYVCLVFFS